MFASQRRWRRAWVSARSCVNSSVSEPLTDAELVRIYRGTIGPLYGYVSRRVGGDAALAEDLVQDTWMRAVGDWPARGVLRARRTRGRTHHRRPGRPV